MRDGSVPAEGVSGSGKGGGEEDVPLRDSRAIHVARINRGLDDASEAGAGADDGFFGGAAGLDAFGNGLLPEEVAEEEAGGHSGEDGMMRKRLRRSMEHLFGDGGDGDEDDEEELDGGDGAGDAVARAGGPAAAAAAAAAAELDDLALYEALTSKKKDMKRVKKEKYTIAPRLIGAMDEAQQLEEGAKRGASYQIMKNRGLTPHKKKLNRNPRVKKREQYRRAVIRRKGQVREQRAPEGDAYAGEATGINARVARGRAIKS